MLDYGSVYSVGFGALGLGPNKLESQEVTKIEALEGLGITRIRAAFGYAVAIRGKFSFLQLLHKSLRIPTS